MATLILGVDVTRVDTSKEFSLGENVWVSGNEYVYCSFAAAEGQYEAIGIDEAWAGASLTTTLAGAIPSKVGAVQVAPTAGSYAWVLIKGSGKVLAATSCAGDVKLYTTATAGVLDDTATTLVPNIRLDETITTAKAALCTLTSQPTCN